MTGVESIFNSLDAWRADVGGTTAGFVAALAAGEPVPPGFAVRRFAPFPELGAGQAMGHDAQLSERPITVDQTNRSVVVDERLIVKWLTQPSHEPHPAPDMLDHLSRAGFAGMPQPHAAVFWTSGTSADSATESRPVLVAIVAGFLPGAVDGWEWCVEDLLAEWAGGPTADFAADLGVLAADLHAALATPSDVFPEPVSQAADADVADWSRTALRTLDEALILTDGDDGEWLAERRDVLAARLETRLPAGQQGTPVLHTHGDLHVGQTLRWRDGLAVTDFDGNPAVPGQPRLQPAARDLAQLLTSLAHVAHVADKQTGWTRTADAIAWAATAHATLLDAYRTRLAKLGFADLLDENLLAAFEVEQECRELIYAARFLPRWRYAPMAVLRSWFPEKGTS